MEQPYECPMSTISSFSPTRWAKLTISSPRYLTYISLYFLISFRSFRPVSLTYECCGLNIFQSLAKALKILEYKKGVAPLPWLKSIVPLCLPGVPLAKIKRYLYVLEVKNLKADMSNLLLNFIYFAIFYTSIVWFHAISYS